VVLHVDRDRRGRRRLATVAVLQRAPGGAVAAAPAARFDADGRCEELPAAADLAALLEERSTC
jgi:pilus assembly protein CpaF